MEIKIRLFSVYSFNEFEIELNLKVKRFDSYLRDVVLEMRFQSRFEAERSITQSASELLLLVGENLEDRLNSPPINWWQKFLTQNF